MSENHQPDHDRLEEAIEAFQRMTVPDRPLDAEVLARLGDGRGHKTGPTSTAIFSKRRYLMRRILVPSAAAAVVLLVAGLGLLLLNNTPAFALGDVVKAAEKHKLVKYKNAETAEVKPGTGSGNPSETSISTAYADLQAPRFRQQFEKYLSLNGAIEVVMFHVHDVKKGRALHVLSETVTDDGKNDPKTAARLKGFPEGTFPRKDAILDAISVDPKGKKPQTFLEQLRDLEKHADAKATKDKVNGREALKYYLEDGPRTTQLWVDAKTKLPVRMEIEQLTSEGPTTKLTWRLTDFEWDPALPKGINNLDQLFDTTPPKGFKLTDNTKGNK
jgi:hypothetical protein